MRNQFSTYCLRVIILLAVAAGCDSAKKARMHYFAADHNAFQYTGRIDFSDKKSPRFWQPGVFINTRFESSTCKVILRDEVLGDVVHNYIEVVVDGKPVRMRLNKKTDTITVAENLSPGMHELSIVKNTEANIGYVEFIGILAESIGKPSEKPERKIEFIGNSITSGTGSDQSAIPCGQGRWEDQHNAYLSYGAITARTLNAQYHLSSVSGIGLMHSCCGMQVTMPQVFDKIQMNANAIPWDFSQYQPDVVTICLGQNDGIQDSLKFTNNYLEFLKQLRNHYPKASLVCLSSPMADEHLNSVLRSYISSIVTQANLTDKNVYSYFFSKRYYHGCDTHPDLEEHQQIATELSSFLKNLMNW